MNRQIATQTNEPQDRTHYLISANELSDRSNQPRKLQEFLNSEKSQMYLGGTTYRYSVWAIRTENGVEIWHIPFDFQGRWINAQKRSWN